MKLLETKRHFLVGAECDGMRLDEFLAGRVASLSRMRIAALLARGACEVNGAPARAGLRLRAGDAVELSDAADAANSMTPERVPLEIVHEDEHIIVVVKPAGVLVHPTRGVKLGTLANALAYHLNRFRLEESGQRLEDDDTPTKDGDAFINRPSETRDPAPGSPQSATPDPQPFVRPGLVHRLDRDTSGLLAVAKTQAALSRLSQHFQRRLVEKRYTAVVSGRVGPDELTIEAPIGREEDARPRWRVTGQGRHAETRLRVLGRGGRRTLLELEPVTGRTNQLRIHCAHAGHAIVGDALYSGEPHARLCLHASRLAFRHPATNDWMEFRSEAPAGLLSAFREDA